MTKCLLSHACRSLLLGLVIFSVPGWSHGELLTAKPASRNQSLFGFTRAVALLPIASEVSGTVRSVYFDVGDELIGGQPLVCIDPTFIDLKIRQQESLNQVSLVDINYFQKQVQRFRQLVAVKKSAQSDLDGFERQLGLAQQNLAAQKVQLATLKEQKKRHCIVGPDHWQMVERQVEPGQWLGMGAPVAVLGDYRRLIVPFSISYDHLKLIQNVPQLQLMIDDSEETLMAELHTVSPTFDPQSRKLMVELIIANSDGRLRAGMRAELIIQERLADNQFELPIEAVQKRYEEHWVKRQNGEEVRVRLLGTVPSNPDLLLIESSQITADEPFLSYSVK